MVFSTKYRIKIEKIATGNSIGIPKPYMNVTKLTFRIVEYL